MRPLKIASYNCQNFNGMLTQIYCKDLLNEVDFLLLQEHWLYEQNFHKFKEIDKSINICIEGKSTMNPEVIRSGRPFGGCAILWNSTIAYKVSSVTTISNRVNCLSVSCKEYTFLLFNVYMPCDSRSEGLNLSIFQDVLAEITILSQNNKADFIIVSGDFNVDFSRDTPQTRELIYFCECETLIPCDLLPTSSIEYTFECKKSGSRSFLDHILISDLMKGFVSQSYPYYDINNKSDHIAIISEITVNCEYLASKELVHEPKISWYKASIHDKKQYQEQLNKELSNIYIPIQGLTCQDVHCTKHNNDLELFANDLMCSCMSAGQKVIPTTVSNTGRRESQVKPGWNEYCKEKREIAMYWHKEWIKEGRRHNTFKSSMRIKSRLQYHYAIRCIEKNKDAIISANMAKSSLANKKDLWLEAKKKRGGHNKLPNMVDGVTGDENISKEFANKFKDIFNSVNYNNGELESIKMLINERLQENMENNTCNTIHMKSKPIIQEKADCINVKDQNISSDVKAELLLQDSDVSDAVKKIINWKI